MNSTVSPRPVEGAQPRVTAKIRISIMPTQKPGTLKPMMEVPISMRAPSASGRTPA